MEIVFLDQKAKSKQEESRWFHYCVSKKIPMVKTVKRTSQGDVDWDYITMDSNDDEFLFSEESWIKSELKELLKYYETPKTEANIGSLTGMVKNLPIEHVSDFAKDVCNTLSRAYQRHKTKKS
ncbi:hypothetical protein [Bacterioplanoides sp.]|uniref:hypothetical protein n=1 Tax=Bacterioplanoides sp. TaxID=2066072 RepID=UPI003AFF733D